MSHHLLRDSAQEQQQQQQQQQQRAEWHRSLHDVEFDLQQGISTKDSAAIRSLLKSADRAGLRVDSRLVHSAHAVLAAPRYDTVNTHALHLKQGMEAKNREQIAASLDKLTRCMAEDAVSAEVGELVERGWKALEELDKASAHWVHFYVKQGIRLRNRDVLKQALDKTPSVAPELLDQYLTSAAQGLLTELDAQHHIKCALQAAIKQKSDMALDTALQQARKLRMGDIAEVSEASRLLTQLRTNGKGSGSRKAGDKKDNKSAHTFQLFGGPLLEAVRRSDRSIPRLCYQCIDFLRARGLHEPDLFRVAGNKEAIEAIRHLYEKGDGNWMMEVHNLEGVHSVAGVLKLYLRMLPEPLIPYSRYDALIKVGARRDSARRSESQLHADLRDQVLQLPTSNYALLCSLVRLLAEGRAAESEQDDTRPARTRVRTQPPPPRTRDVHHHAARHAHRHTHHRIIHTTRPRHIHTRATDRHSTALRPRPAGCFGYGCYHHVS